MLLPLHAPMALVQPCMHAGSNVHTIAAAAPLTPSHMHTLALVLPLACAGYRKPKNNIHKCMKKRKE